MSLKSLLQSAPNSHLLTDRHLSLDDHALWQSLIQEGLFTEEDLFSQLKGNHSFHQTLPLSVQSDIQTHPLYEEARAHQCLLLGETENALYIATSNPYAPFIQSLEGRVHPVLIPHASLMLALEDFEPGIEHVDIDLLIRYAHLLTASDIHIHQDTTGGSIFFRLQGALRPIQTLSETACRDLIQAIKFHAHLDISIQTRPQDGRFTWKTTRHRLDCRVASLPTVHGEDLVVRLLDMQVCYQSFEALGFSDVIFNKLPELLELTSGLILVTGPTGSGKTTSLYAMLNHLRKGMNKAIVTLEDPVEQLLPDVKQSQINPDNGYTFTAGLKAVLRQDPDVIMVGEIRDKETAKIALDAAYTGHLVLASVHTSDVQTTLHRLYGFELDPFLVGHSLKAILSQRLVPACCTHCSPDSVCNACHGSGVYGRTVLGELFYTETAPHIMNWETATETLLSAGTLWSFSQEKEVLQSQYKIPKGIS